MNITGIVIHGKGEGGKFGFPTANIEYTGKLEKGVYRGVIIRGKKTFVAAVIKKDDDLLEAHILDFQGDLYGEKIELQIKEKLREIINFKGKEQFLSQAQKDIEIIRNK